MISSALSDIDIEGASHISISSNNLVTATNGIVIGASSTGCMIGTNTFTVTTQISDASASCQYSSITGTKPTYP
jgi:hypothetical protein